MVDRIWCDASDRRPADAVSGPCDPDVLDAILGPAVDGGEARPATVPDADVGPRPDVDVLRAVADVRATIATSTAV